MSDDTLVGTKMGSIAGGGIGAITGGTEFGKYMAGKLKKGNLQAAGGKDNYKYILNYLIGKGMSKPTATKLLIGGAGALGAGLYGLGGAAAGGTVGAMSDASSAISEGSPGAQMGGAAGSVVGSVGGLASALKAGDNGALAKFLIRRGLSPTNAMMMAIPGMSVAGSYLGNLAGSVAGKPLDVFFRKREAING